MDRNAQEMIFDKQWKEYLELEKLIHEYAVKAEYDQGATYKGLLYDLCMIGKQMSYTLIEQAKTLWNGSTIQTLENACEVKRADFDEIADRMTKGNRK